MAPAAFDLSGIGPALARLRACHLGQQPGGLPTAVSPGEVTEPFLLDAAFPRSARLMTANLFQDEDYPASALRAGESGVVGFVAEVGPDGRVTDCVITASSGSAALDLTTCRLVKLRARFVPALDEAGRATADRLRGRIAWRLPAD
jgi:protein TonB